MSPRPSILKSAPEGVFRIARPLAGVNPSRKKPISVPAPDTRSILYNWTVPTPTVNKASPEPDGTPLFATNVSTPGGMSKPLAVEKFTPTEPTGFWMPPYRPGGPTGGIQNPVGSVGVNFSTANGFDIPPGVDTLVANSGVPSGSGLALLTVGVGTVQLYSIDLVSGAGTLIGFFLDGFTPASGLAILNTPSGADFNIDGRGDILWRHDSGQVYFWNMNGLQTNGEGSVAHAPVPNDWHIEGTGDFNGDFNSDILWRHDSGQVYFWEMNGLTIKAEGGVAHAPVPNDWHIQRLGDFDGDAKSDILWRHDSGQVYIWEMNGLGIKAEGGVAHALVPNDWHIQSVGDFNGDGKSDILWRQDGSGQVYVWEMNGLQVTAEGAVAHAPVPSEWHVFSDQNFI